MPDLVEIHQSALKEFDDIQTALKDERNQCIMDRRFYSIAGAQWEDDLGKQFANRPKFEVNKIHLSVIRIINEYRNNRVTVDFTAKDGTEDDFSESCDGRYRADEQDSCGQEAYDNAFEEGTSGGIGAWRYTTVYEDEEDDENDFQRIKIEPIYDADISVFFDLNAKRQDKADAKRCYVLTALPIDTYIEEYGGDPIGWPQGVYTSQFDWFTPDIVYIAELYKVEQSTETIEIWQSISGEEERFKPSDFENNPDLLKTLNAIGSKKIAEKKKKVRKVHKYLMNGSRIIEDLGYIAGKNIPITVYYGKRWVIDSVERCMGHVRLSKDAQRLKNMQLSKLGEISALSSIEKPIVTPEQMLGHQEMWADDNIKDFPYLFLNPTYDQEGQLQLAGPLGYTKPPQVPPALAALLQITEQDMQDLLGNQQSAEEIQPNVSGKAIELVQNKLDMQTYIYMDNFAKAMRRGGEIWLSIAREIYVEDDRILKILTKAKEPESIKLMQPIINQETGKKEYKNDFAKANFDVNVEVGPSTSSKRAATVRELTGMLTMTKDPETQTVLSSLALMNIEGEGLSDVQEYFRRKLIRMGALKPSEEEAKELAAEMQNQKPDPQSEYFQSAAKEALAKAQKAKADTILTAARAEETKAKTVKTLSEIDQKERNQTVDTIKKLTDIQNASTPQISQGEGAYTYGRSRSPGNGRSQNIRGRSSPRSFDIGQ
jgi:hypothetical protein